MNEQEKLAKINRATISEAILDRLNPELEDQEKKVIVDLKQSFRGGTLSYEHAVSLVAKLVAFEDLRVGLLQKIKSGNKIREEMT